MEELKKEFENQIEQAFLVGTNGLEEYVSDAAKGCAQIASQLLEQKNSEIQKLRSSLSASERFRIEDAATSIDDKNIIWERNKNLEAEISFLKECVKKHQEKNQHLPLSQLGDFVDWIRDNRFKMYAEGWCPEGGANGWHCSTEELLKAFHERGPIG